MIMRWTVLSKADLSMQSMCRMQGTLEPMGCFAQDLMCSLAVKILHPRNGQVVTEDVYLELEIIGLRVPEGE